jgi:endonuclease/exonuclease/phosphatase (EEP) superfamily protein YafD
VGSKLLSRLVSGYALLACLWLLLRRLTGDRPWWLQLVNEFAPLILAPSPIVLLVSLLKRGCLRTCAALVPALAFMSFYGQRFAMKSFGPAHGPRIRIMTLNALCRSRPVEKMVEAILESDADIVMLQEVLPAAGSALREALLDSYPYQAIYPADRARGSAVFSRLPVDCERKFQLSADGWNCQKVRIRWADRSLAVFNIHLMSPLKLFPKCGERYYDSSTRSSEMQSLIEHMQVADCSSVIVAGDFNMTDQSLEYQAMREHARDAFLDAGSGFGFTYPARTALAKYWHERQSPPVLRLDHVFYQGGLRARAARVGSNGDSDHYSLVVDLEALEDERLTTD